ncbi:MAG: LLM class flavin-dependent oxidoreductase [Dehalococcoidia bacterium]
MRKKLRYGTGAGRHQTMHDVGEHAAAAERYGFEHLTILDDINLTRDVYVLLTAAAMATSKILIGTGVTHPYTRHPVQTAVAVASIHELSRGRAFLGLGAGHLYGLIGMSNGKIADMREVVHVARHLSRGEEVELKNGTKVRSPWMKDPYPIYLAAEGPRSLQLAGEVADATWIQGMHPTLIEWRMENIEKGLEVSGRSRDDIDIWLRAAVVLADSKEEGRKIARPFVATKAHEFCMAVLKRDNDESNRIKSMLPQALLDDFEKIWGVWDLYEHEEYEASHAQVISDQLVDALAIVGTPEQCAEAIGAALDAGYDGVSMTVFTHRDKIAFWRDFHNEVVPLLE